MSSSSSVSGWMSSPVLKKVITGVTGLGLTLFVIGHMVGNLAMFSGQDAYNVYAHFLMSLGPLLYAIELGLTVFFLFHIVVGIKISIGNRRARKTRYAVSKSSGGPSRLTASSRSMIVTGLLIMVFLVIHLLSFKFGPGGPGNASASYVTTIDGVEMRDLAKLVHEKFQTPWYTFGYAAIMLLLMIHLRHGIWSALQSLGAMRPSLTPIVYTVGGLLGMGIAAGFIAMPLAIYFGFI